MKRLLSLAASLLCCGVAAAAPPSPIHWTLAGPAKPVAPGKLFWLALTARIDPGWHLYALDEPEGGPNPTEVGLPEGDALTLLDVVAAKPIMVPDPVLRQTVGMFLHEVVFKVHVRAPQKPVAAGAVSQVIVHYQSCNDQVCLPPRTETITLPLDGVLH